MVTLLHGLVELTFRGPQYNIIFWLLASVIYQKYKSAAKEKADLNLNTALVVENS